MTYYERHLPHWHPDEAAFFVTWRLYGTLPKSQRTEDEPGPLWLQSPVVAGAVAESIVHAAETLGFYTLLAWVVMPNHVHILIEPEVPLFRITRSLKTFTARRANSILGRTGRPFWQSESYDHWIRDEDEMERTIKYIEHNPVTAGLVATPELWPWSSASQSRAER